MKYLFNLPIGSIERLVFVALIVSCLTAVSLAQSTDLRFPTPVRTSEIAGTIKARDVGDSRLTTYYYTFEGEQGDLFVNVQSRNFSGDIDVYILAGQRPLTKIVTYADVAENETGRVIYLRKPERLLLRVEGRSPGDDDASFRIKFAGSFAASKLDDNAEPAVPKATAENDTNVRVNSVGTILEVIPKAKPSPEAIAEKTETLEPERKADEEKPTDDAVTPSEEKRADVEAEPKKTEVVVSDPLEDKKAESTPRNTAANRRSRRTRNTRSTATKPAETTDAPPALPSDAEAEAKPASTAASRRTRRADSAREKKEPAPDPMAGVSLVITFKDGSLLERPMNEVMRFSVERAVLTVINKNGSIGRYQMTEVASVTIR